MPATTSKPADKVIMTCAVTGAVHVPSMALSAAHAGADRRNAIGAAEAGAAILHLHARNPKDGKPTPDPEMFMRLPARDQAGTDAVVNITTGGGQGMTLEERLAAAAAPSRRCAR